MLVFDTPVVAGYFDGDEGAPKGSEVGRRGGEGGWIGERLYMGDRHAEGDAAGGAGAGVGDVEEVAWEGGGGHC